LEQRTLIQKNTKDKLIDILAADGKKFIPSNVVLDKTLPGIGATYMEIHAKRHSIIIEPNVPVIKGKVKKHPELNLLGVYKGVNKPKIVKYLKNSAVKYKKIITTPEGFSKIRKAAQEVGVNIFKDYFCLFDECERITQDVGYRKNISNPVMTFLNLNQRHLFQQRHWIFITQK
jgi:hypothetical protein